MSRRLHRWSLGVAVALLTLATLRYGLTSIATYDIWWHIKTGEQILATRSLLPTDPFSYTFQGKPWPFKDWLADVLLAWVYGWGGLAALVLLTCAAVVVTMVAIVWVLRRARRCEAWVTVTVAAVCLGAVGFRFSERPATLAFALTAVILALLDRARQRDGQQGGVLWVVLWVVPLTALMANLHRGSLAIAPLVAAYCVAEWFAARRAAQPVPWRRLGALAIGTVLAAIASPTGWSAVTQAFDVMAVNDYRTNMPEWEPLTFASVMEATPASLLLLVAVLLGWRRVRPLWDVLLVVLGSAFAFAGVRFFPYFGLLAAPAAASSLQRWAAGWSRASRSVVVVCAAAGVLAYVSVSAQPPVGLGLQERRYPTRALDFVRERTAAGELGGEMFNEYSLGGFLLFHLWPERRIYIDGRSNQVYDAAFVARYRELLTNGPALRREAVQRGIEWLFVDNRPWDAARAAIDRRWTLVFASERGLIYVDADGPNAAMAQRLGYRFLRPHELFQSIAEAWPVANNRRAVVMEARRMVREDETSLPAHMALAYVLDLLGPAADAELQEVTNRLVELGWDPSMQRR